MQHIKQVYANSIDKISTRSHGWLLQKLEIPQYHNWVTSLYCTRHMRLQVMNIFHISVMNIFHIMHISVIFLVHISALENLKFQECNNDSKGQAERWSNKRITSRCVRCNNIPITCALKNIIQDLLFKPAKLTNSLSTTIDG